VLLPLGRFGSRPVSNVDDENVEITGMGRKCGRKDRRRLCMKAIEEMQKKIM
jgi:hypothetical protein